MTGNTIEMYDPGNSNGNVNTYPNIQWTTDDYSMEPSIRGKQLYIPLDAFFCESSKTALPLVALQYQISIKIILKPLMDLYTINNVNEAPDVESGISYRIQPNKIYLTTNYGDFYNLLKMFLQTQYYTIKILLIGNLILI